MWAPGLGELVIILLIVLAVFGGGKLAGVGKSLGTAISEFKDAVTSEEEEKKEVGAEKSDAAESSSSKEDTQAASSASDEGEKAHG